MIRIVAVDFDHFFTVFGRLAAAGVEVTSAGGNELSVPNDTSRDLLRQVADTGAVVHADLGGPAADDDPEPDDEPERESDRDPESESEAGSEVEPEPEPEPELGAEPGTEPDPAIEPSPEPISESEPEPEPVIEPEPVAAKPAPKKTTRARRKTTTEE